MSNQKGQHPNKKGEGKINISNKGNLSNSAIHWSLSMSECEPKFSIPILYWLLYYVFIIAAQRRERNGYMNG